jgi:TolB protein
MISKSMRWAGIALVSLACSSDVDEPNPSVPGTLLVTVSTTGATLDPNGYAVEVDGLELEQVELNGSVEVVDLPPGEHAMAVTGVAANCSVTPPQPRTILIAPAEQTIASIAVRCDSLLRNAIVFARIHDGTSTIYWISPEGSLPLPIIEGGSPTISPDGRQIAFDRVGPGFIAVWTANVDGTSPVRLTFSGEVNQSPRWSPSGDRIAFGSNRDGNYEIYTMRVDGSDQRRLTTDIGQDGFPVWSPDGTRLAFTRTLEPQSNTEVFLMNADGTGAVNVTVHPEGDNILDWAPGGGRLLINTTREWQLSNEIFTIALDGSNPVNLTNHEAFDGDAKWSPGGEAIVFSSERNDHIHSLYRAGADGQGVVRLTTPDIGQADVSVAWVP